MKRGVFFIIWMISSAVWERTESMAGGRDGVVEEEASWVEDLGPMGKGVSVEGGRLLTTSFVQDIAVWMELQCIGCVYQTVTRCR